MGGTGSKSKDTPKDGIPDFTTPSGLYHSLNWDLKIVKRLILTKRLAPLFPGQEECSNADTDLEECPICFLFYPGGLNRSACCKKGICTECFLQIKKPNGQAFCPFCQRGNYTVSFMGPLSKEEKDRDAWEQQKVIEAKIRMRNDEIEQDLKREQQKRERTLSVSEVSHHNQTAPPSSSPPNGLEILISQSLPATSSVLTSPYHPSFSTSYPPPTKEIKKREMELEDLMLQEALRLSLMTPDNGSDTETMLDDSMSSEVEDIQNTSDTNRDDLELALALALSLQNVIK